MICNQLWRDRYPLTPPFKILGINMAIFRELFESKRKTDIVLSIKDDRKTGAKGKATKVRKYLETKIKNKDFLVEADTWSGAVVQISFTEPQDIDYLEELSKDVMNNFEDMFYSYWAV
jgi:hypothetical protein